MKILVMWPPHIPSYFNAGHHLSVFQTAAYLRQAHPTAEVKTCDAGSLDVTWKEIGELFYQFKPDVLVVINDFDNVDNLDRLLVYVRELSPRTRVITGGRLGVQARLPMRQFDVNAVIESGDVEAAVSAYVAAISEGEVAAQIAGVAVRRGGEWTDAPRPGRTLPADEWILPDVTEIPYASYDRMYSRDQNKFCGIPQRRELVVPVGRGCPINCSFCEVPSVQGLRDRRLAVETVVDYIAGAQKHLPFDYVSFYAPTFTFDRKWTVALCEALIESPAALPWKCATAIPHLDEELIRLMAASGCIRISVGLETLEPEGLLALPRRKRTEVMRFEELNEIAEDCGVELNYFVIVGLPGTSVAGTQATIDAIKAVGARVRPTVYSSMDKLRATTSKQDLWRFNRQLIEPEVGDDSVSSWYEYFFGVEEHVTRVMENIPSVVERHASAVG